MLLTNLFRRLRGTLLPSDKAVLEAVASRVPPDLREHVKCQVGAINKVQRLTQGREVNFYRMHRGKPTFEEGIRLPSQREETVIARASVRMLDTNVQVLVSVWLVRGFVFSLVLNKSIPHSSNVDGNFVVDSCEILPGALGCKHMSPESHEDLPAGLATWHLDGKIEGWHVPLQAVDRETRLAALGSALPQGYLAILAICDGFSCGRIQVKGLVELGPTPVGQNSIILLANIGEHFGVATMEGARDPAIYFVNNAADDYSRRLGADFRAALVEGLRISGQ